MTLDTEEWMRQRPLLSAACRRAAETDLVQQLWTEKPSVDDQTIVAHQRIKAEDLPFQFV